VIHQSCARSKLPDSSAKVVAVEGDEVALDATVFFPGGGGQMPDRGIMSWNNRQDEGNVIAMNKRDEVVWHTLDCLPPPLGTEAVGTIDWDFRYRMMRTHTALHILCGTTFREFGVQVAGGQRKSAALTLRRLRIKAR
jgi:misacylated tRNA(Ala) deacylase